MESQWIAVPASLALGAAGASVTALRSALLILGEDGIESSAAGDPTGARVLAAVRDPSSRYPFSLWVAAASLKTGSALLAGGAAFSFAHTRDGWIGLFAAACWSLTWLMLLFLLEHLATQGVMQRPESAIRRAGRWALVTLGAAGAAARGIDRIGRLLFGSGYSPEGLMDIRFGSEEGILDVIEEGAEHGTIDPDEERMIEGVLRFGESTVAEGMTARSDVVFLRAGMSRREVDAVIAGAGFSSYPVLAADGESVTGILQTKRLFGGGAASGWEALADRPFYVPESMKVPDLFRHFQRSRLHMAVVIDEHGKLWGIITLHDLVEQILGRLSEGEAAGELPEWEKDGALSAPGSTPVRLLRDEYGIDLPMGPAYETAGGYALDRLQDVPEGAIAFRADGYRVTVTETDRFRIRRIRFEKLPPEPPSA